MDKIKGNKVGGILMKENNDDKFTATGTNIDAVKEANQNSGMSYNEVKEFLAKTTGGHGTEIYSDTNTEAVSEKNQQSREK